MEYSFESINFCFLYISHQLNSRLTFHNFKIKPSVALVHNQAASVVDDKFTNRVVNIFSMIDSGKLGPRL